MASLRRAALLLSHMAMFALAGAAQVYNHDLSLPPCANLNSGTVLTTAFSVQDATLRQPALRAPGKSLRFVDLFPATWCPEKQLYAAYRLAATQYCCKHVICLPQKILLPVHPYSILEEPESSVGRA